MLDFDLKKIISDEYLLNIIKIDKNKESSVGNVYIIETDKTKFVAKIYDDLNHTLSMINLHSNLSNKFYIPKIILNKNNTGYIKINNSKYIVLYSFLEGIQIGEFNELNENIIKMIATELRKLHDMTNNLNKYKLKDVPFNIDYNLTRKSLLHFDLTKSNIFYNNKIGFIDFDDAKYGLSVCDVAILIALLFFSKKRGVNKKGINIFVDNYYGKDLDLKLSETKYIKEIAIKWIDHTLNCNEFNPSTKESFEIKKRLMEENLF